MHGFRAKIALTERITLEAAAQTASALTAEGIIWLRMERNSRTASQRRNK